MNKKTLMMMLAVAVAMLAAGGGAAYYMTQNGMIGGQTQGTPAPPPETVGMIALQPFLTNVNDSSGRRHARVEVKLAVSPMERADEVSTDTLAMARLRDQVLTLIASQSITELTSPDGKADLRRQIVEGAAPIVAPGSVKEVLFGELIVQ